MTKVAPYEKLADVYDHLMKHVDYKSWAAYINKLIFHWHPETKSVLDVSCGTGNLIEQLQKYPFELSGCDQSLPMLRKAKEKKNIDTVPFWQCSMLEISARPKVDVILCLYDSINYIMEKEKIVKFINDAQAVLRDGGLLVFDICTERNAIKYFYNFYDHVEQKSFSYDRWSHYDKKNKIQYTEFKIRFFSEKAIYLEKHQQRIYSIRAILSVLSETSMELLEVYDGFTMQPAHSKSNRLHFILRRGST